jgi:hypothetical protein
MLNELGVENLLGSVVEHGLHAAAIVKQYVLASSTELHASLGHWLHLHGAAMGSGGGGSGTSSSGTATIVGGAAAGGAVGGAVVQGGKSAKQPGTK